jgi:molybdopterin synthase catalytic subunit
MQVWIQPFGVLKELFAKGPFPFELREAATVSDLLEDLNESLEVVSESGSAPPDAKNAALALRGIAVSVNAEYAQASHVLREGDEVGLLPPVSGGCGDTEVRVDLTRDPIQGDALIAAIKHGEDGAVVVFDGIVRNNTRGRQTLYLDYEAYEEMAEKQMRELACEAVRQFAVRQGILVHRLGRLEVGETSVLIVVASAHRAQAFEACRWLIDTLKKTVPIWKKETFADGAVWAAGEPFPAGLAVELEASHES